MWRIRESLNERSRVKRYFDNSFFVDFWSKPPCETHWSDASILRYSVLMCSVLMVHLGYNVCGGGKWLLLKMRYLTETRKLNNQTNSTCIRFEVRRFVGGKEIFHMVVSRPRTLMKLNNWHYAHGMLLNLFKLIYSCLN